MKNKNERTLQELLSFNITLLPDIKIYHITDNSKQVKNGSLFIAVAGNTINGNNYINEAIANGAIVIVTYGKKQCVAMNDGILYVYTNNVRFELSYIASKFFDYSLENIVAVTGTNGKSSTVDIVRQICENCNLKSASIGTLGVICNGEEAKLQNHLTSPGSIDLHKILCVLSCNGIKNVALEASSHGIEQFRIGNIKYSVCAFTNFSQDHLDYHKTMENYWIAKEKLFLELSNEETVFVINVDDEKSDYLIQIAKNRGIKYLDYGFAAKHIQLLNIYQNKEHQQITLKIFEQEKRFILPLFGTFQAYNTLCAIAICIALNIEVNKIIEAIAHLHSINGRLEKICSHNNANIYVDYAHTPDALQNAILSLKGHTDEKIIVLFGCGGNRDSDKRSIMGKIASDYADFVIVTDDNSRNESASDIRKEIISDIIGQQFTNIADRTIAINYAISMLNSGDSLLIAGKGHETYQECGNGKVKHFSDKEMVINIVNNLKCRDEYECNL